MNLGPQKMMIVFCDETDMWKEERLYPAIVRVLERQGIAGATVLSGMMGYGVHRRIHRKGLFGVSDEKPVAIIVIDREEKLKAVLPTIMPMVREGLITMQDAEVIYAGQVTANED